MVPTAIGSEGQILEWNEEFEEVDQHHRHLSHLYELHPDVESQRRHRNFMRQQGPVF